MVKAHLKIKLLLTIVILLIIASLVAGCAPSRDLDSSIKTSTAPFRFDLMKWEFESIIEEIGSLFHRHPVPVSSAAADIEKYFAGTESDETPQIDSGIATADIEKFLETQIREAYSEQGIYHPAQGLLPLKIGFPPVNIHLANPPKLLVVSPRDRIESIRQVTLLPEMSEKDMETIESSIDELGFSALIVNTGGMATYPSFVSDNSGLRFALNTAAEEWLHQYLTFTPLGFLYIFDRTGIRHDYEIATMNETVAGIVSKEIGGSIYAKYYTKDTADQTGQEAADTGFDFNREMRDIRKSVDVLLASGEIEQAEKFMNEKQQFLALKGYQIRKLNQAYFAFHGTYADGPDSISPIGADLNKLRDRSSSLKEFVEKVSVMTSPQDISKSIR